jgi:transcriptional regulator of arginine metabolism
MKERITRLKAIKKLIKTYHIESQDALLGYLQSEGIIVTQATLSRDLKLLKVGKVSDGNRGYIYSLPSDDEQREGEKSYAHDFMRGYISIDWSGNLAVIRTYIGFSDSVAIAVENLGFEDVLGTLAGDNTVLVVLREGISGEEFWAKLKQSIPELED